MPSREDDALTRAAREETVKFRGITYTLRELEIGEFDKIAEASTKKVEVDDGNGGTVEVDRIDGSLQSRLMLAKCLTSPKGIKITEIPTRVYGALNRMVNTMHFGEELDELKAAKDKTAKDGDEEPVSGN